MRRWIALASLFAVMLVTALPAQAENPHFVPSAWTGTQDLSSGVVKVGYQVAGLGSNGAGYVRMRGWVDVAADCYNGRKMIGHFADHQDRVAEHGLFANKQGTYTEKNWSLNPASVCPPGTTIQNASYKWGTITMYLWNGTSPGSETSAQDYLYFECTTNTCKML